MVTKIEAFQDGIILNNRSLWPSYSSELYLLLISKNSHNGKCCPALLLFSEPFAHFQVEEQPPAQAVEDPSTSEVAEEDDDADDGEIDIQVMVYSTGCTIAHCFREESLIGSKIAC